MNNQFATQFLLEEFDADKEAFRQKMVDYLVRYCGANKDAATMLAKAAADHVIDFEKAIEICKATTGLSEDGMGVGSTTGGGVTNGASWSSGTNNGEQMTGRKKMEEGSDSPMFKVGQKVAYLGHPAVITKVEKDMMGRWNYNVSYNKGTGLTKATNILNKGEEIKSVNEDAPMLAAGKADISTYTQDGFKKTEGHPKLKSIDVDDLWDTKPTAMSEELEETWYKPDYKKILQLLSKIKEKNESVYEKIKYALEMDLAPHTYSDVVDAAAKAGIQENYNRFKKETKIRPKQDQYHEAIKAVNKKLDEVNRILEFTTRMKEELSEGEETLEVKARTAKSMDKLKTKIAEAYKKLKHLN